MSTTPALEFSNLPTDTIGKIIEKCDLKEQLTLRKVSKNLRSLVDKQKIAYKSIQIDLMDSYILCVYNGKKVVYASENWDENKQLGFDYVKIALNDVSIALNNPKLRLNELTVRYYSNDRTRQFSLSSLLKHPNHKLNVKNFTFYWGSPEYLLSILRCFQPKELVNIKIHGLDYDQYGQISQTSKIVNEIASLEQWKQAEELTLDEFNLFRLEFLMHFKRFIIETKLDMKSLKRLIGLFSTSTKFESCTFVLNDFVLFRHRTRSTYLEMFCEKVDTGDEDVLLYHYKIPDDSNKVLEFELDEIGREIIISKKSL